jgi:hypothetical protein
MSYYELGNTNKVKHYCKLKDLPFLPKISRGAYFVVSRSCIVLLGIQWGSGVVEAVGLDEARDGDDPGEGGEGVELGYELEASRTYRLARLSRSSRPRLSFPQLHLQLAPVLMHFPMFV